jgi:hypothetical protein
VHNIDGPKRRNAPFRVLTLILYAPPSKALVELGDGTIRLDRLPAARQLQMGPDRLRECLQWLHERAYITLLASERGRSTLRIEPPRRTFANKEGT